MVNQQIIKPMPDLPHLMGINVNDLNMLESIMAPVMIKAALIQQIKDMPREAFGDITGIKLFYNLFSLLNFVNDWLRKNHRWDDDDEKGAYSTKVMLANCTKDLEQRLGIIISPNTVFKSE